MMKTRVLVALLACLLAAPVSGSAQRRRKSTSRRPAPAADAPAVDLAAETDRRAAAGRVAEQIKVLTHFLYLLGGVVKSVESVDKAAQANNVPASATQQTERSKTTIRESIRNVQSGLTQLENEFSAKPSLRPYFHLVIGVSEIANQATQQADAGQFDQAGRSLLRAVDKLADALAAMRQSGL
jgi:hypothetical protein